MSVFCLKKLTSSQCDVHIKGVIKSKTYVYFMVMLTVRVDPLLFSLHSGLRARRTKSRALKGLQLEVILLVES